MRFFSIIVVCLNAGGKLRETIKSILGQSFCDYEIIIKDGGSADGSLEEAETLYRGDERVRVYKEKDGGIYEAMNQAVGHAKGQYLLFLNCGDSFYDGSVLERVRAGIRDKAYGGPAIYYGDVFEKRTGSVVASNPRLDAFACYRNIPCHQVCFYDRRLFEERAYDTGFKVRADYEHFLWCVLARKAGAVYLPVAVASYEGGGFSETPVNRRLAAREHKAVIRLYMTKGQALAYRLILLMTLAPLRGRIAGSRRLSGIYNMVKKALYHSG